MLGSFDENQELSTAVTTTVMGTSLIPYPSLFAPLSAKYLSSPLVMIISARLFLTQKFPKSFLSRSSQSPFFLMVLSYRALSLNYDVHTIHQNLQRFSLICGS
jgi:hypothetical protein